MPPHRHRPATACCWAALGLLLGLGDALPAGECTVTLAGFETGAFRWKDVGGNLYGAAYQAGYSYAQANVGSAGS